jgi:alanine racemase
MIKKIAKKIISKFKKNKFQPMNHIEISRLNLIDNFNLIQSKNPSKQIIPVLKSNAYGHGLTEIGRLLNLAKCDLIAVDGYFEALNLANVSNHRILVMGYIDKANFNILKFRKFSFVVQTTEDIISLGRLNKLMNIHLELNTGMNRLGLDPKDLDLYLTTLKRFPKINLEGVMTHLADADNINNSFTRQQTNLFDKLVQKIINQGFNPKYIHIAQTCGSVKVCSQYANALRIGIGLYGINPLSPSDKYFKDYDGLKPVLQLKSKIIKVMDLIEDDKVSYNGTFTAKGPMKIGVLPLGYYEGVPRELSNCGFVTSDDKIMPIIGRVCMNHTTIDLTKTDLKTGDEVTIISDNKNKPNSIENICKNNKIFSYSLLTNISSTIRRTIIW